ncbi:MAG: N-6 DNA methylase [Armatimonadetes bacterium]|nr:N-6 DNA methylase [Armatimonadota bacterium]
MRNGAQLSLFGGAGKGHLFDPEMLSRYLREHRTTLLPDLDARARAIRDWVDGISATTAGEATLEHKFVSDILHQVLGYVAHPQLPASLYPKPGTATTGIRGTPDVALGEFTASETRFTAVMELKSPGADLDLPQPGHGNKTPVEQAFDYGRRILGVRWVLVSDMRVIRLYSVESAGEYEEVALGDCVTADGKPTESFTRLHFLLHHDYLVSGHEGSQVALLHDKSAASRLKMRDSFYDAYYNVRADLYNEIRLASSQLPRAATRDDILEATQRLLDRLLFIYYCEDHPQGLVPKATLEDVIAAARRLPGASQTKTYDYMKALFREIDAGSPPGSGVGVYGYNGELFKDHWIIDHISLPDSLHDRRYALEEPDGNTRWIRGVWGLHVYDFWTELSEHLLGHIFEQSLSDLSELGSTEEVPLSEKMRERKRGGVFYTTSILSDFLSAGALTALLDEAAPLEHVPAEELPGRLQERLNRLLALRVADFACGSGAFLVSAYGEMLQEFWRLRSSLDVLVARDRSFDTLLETETQAGLLRHCLFGVDKLPQAVEIAKLALWLRSARKEEKVPDLSGNVVAADSLDVAAVFDRLHMGEAGFDLVIGNPPWGGEMDEEIRARALHILNLPEGSTWDSWELFLLLAIRALREGGRLALVLPDSFFYPEKARTRRGLFEATAVEKVYNLGPDWFGSMVRMGTVVVQARRGASDLNSHLHGLLLTGKLRREAIRAKVPLTQIEAQCSRPVPIRRVVESPTCEVEVFRGARDDAIMRRMTDRSIPLGTLCERGRGEEVNKAGLVWECPSCLGLTTPGTKRKGGGHNDKLCEQCGHRLTEASVATTAFVVEAQPQTGSRAPFIDGDDLNERYRRIVPSKWMLLDPSRWSHKSAGLYKPPKILLRQAGVGILAALDETDARCPQSVYIYRLRDAYLARGYRHEFVLGALLSRTMSYFVLKRFSEADPAKAFAKLTHERLADLPVPDVQLTDAAHRTAHDTIVENVGSLLRGTAHLGGKEDLEIEQVLRDLWAISNADGAYINGEFHDLPDSQPIRDLFPNGRPRPVAALSDSDGG